MKLTLIFVFAAYFSAVAASHGQTVSFTLKEASLEQAFQKIRKQSNYSFLYTKELIKNAKKVTVDFANEDVVTAIEKCMIGQPFNYKIIDKVVVINTKNIAVARHEIAGILQSSLSTSQVVSGTVSDHEGHPLSGVNILEKGTTNGTTTDEKGKFKISVKDIKSVLVITRIGFVSIEMAIAGRSVIAVSLVPDYKQVEQEVFAIGYGTVQKGDLTGALSNIKGERFQDQAIYSVENALAGRVAGVKVVDGAQPGSGGSVTIRGANSMLGGTEPLYVIDGIPVEANPDAAGGPNRGATQSSLNFLDPSSIQDIVVLKDASATSVYGARGANGVVLITTKQGSKNNESVTFEVTSSLAKVTREREVLDGPQFANWMNMSASNLAWLSKSWWDYQQERLANGEITTLPNATPWGFPYNSQSYTNPGWEFDGVKRPLPNSAELPNTNWQNEIFNTGRVNNYHLGYAGGSESTTYSLGLNYLDQNGIIIGSKYKRINAFMNLNRKMKRFTVNAKMNITKGEANAAMTNNGHPDQNLISKAVLFAPTNSLLSDGETFEVFDFNDLSFQDSPYDIATKLIDDKKQLSILASVGLDYKISKDLLFKSIAGLTHNTNQRNTYWPQSTFVGKASKGDATSAGNGLIKYLTQFQLVYTKQFNKNHRINSTIVYAYEDFNRNSNFVQVKNFPTDVLDYKNLSSGVDFTVPTNFFSHSVLTSYLTRTNYAFKDKYLLTAALRADGASLFARNNKWGYFPSGALAWKIKSEPFLYNVHAISNLKLRISYGKTGSQAIEPYQSLAILGTKNYTFNGSIASGFYERNLENPDLKWEQTSQYNVGLDIGILKNRVNLVLDYYLKKTTDLLMVVQNPPSSGFATKISNLGAVENRGLEAEISAIVSRKELKWNIYGNFSKNRNKVLSMGSYDYQYSSYQMISGARPIIFKVGEPIGSFVGYQHVKIFENWGEIAKSAQPGAYVGDMMYKDNNNDGVLNEDDMVIIGNPNPKFSFGITNEFRYKNFDLSLLVDGQVGGQIYSIEDMSKLSSNFWDQASVDAAVNSWVPVNGDRPVGNWQLPDGSTYSTSGYDYGFGNQDAYTARPMFNRMSSAERKRLSDEYIRDASFIKFRNVSLGYNLNTSKGNALNIKSLRVYVSATNLITITKFDGFDPEISAYVSDPGRRGLYFGTYPLARTLTVGIKAAF